MVGCKHTFRNARRGFEKSFTMNSSVGSQFSDEWDACVVCRVGVPGIFLWDEIGAEGSIVTHFGAALAICVAADFLFSCIGSLIKVWHYHFYWDVYSHL